MPNTDLHYSLQSIIVSWSQAVGWAIYFNNVQHSQYIDGNIPETCSREFYSVVLLLKRCQVQVDARVGRSYSVRDLQQQHTVLHVLKFREDTVGYCAGGDTFCMKCITLKNCQLSYNSRQHLQQKCIPSSSYLNLKWVIHSQSPWWWPVPLQPTPGHHGCAPRHCLAAWKGLQPSLLASGTDRVDIFIVVALSKTSKRNKYLRLWEQKNNFKETNGLALSS